MTRRRGARPSGLELRDRQSERTLLWWGVPVGLLLLGLSLSVGLGGGPGPFDLDVVDGLRPAAADAAASPFVASSDDAPRSVPTPSPGPDPESFDVDALRDPAPGVPRPVARYDDLVLLQPTSRPLVTGFHEASTSRALPLEPIGQLVANRNTTRTDAPLDDPDGLPYLILHSRGRTAPATSAVDVVMVDDDPVRAPVTGTVTEVRGFQLGGRYADLRIELRPDDAPELRVVIIHVAEPLVAVGDRVRAGETALAGTARRFPFFSQIDAETAPERWPHVHLEVQRAGHGDDNTDEW